MDVRQVTPTYSVAPQPRLEELAELARRGYRSIICNRPDGEDPDQPTFQEIETEARRHGLEAYQIAVAKGMVGDEEVARLRDLLPRLEGPVLAYCRTGTRAMTLWALAQSTTLKLDQILAHGKRAGYDLSGVALRILNRGQLPRGHADVEHQIVIVGAGAAGISAAASLRRRNKKLDIALIDPAEIHYYQPGWTLVGAGVFSPRQTVRTMASLIPKGVEWIQSAVAAFDPAHNTVILEGCRTVRYQYLIVCPGLKLDWNQIEGLPETLGQNGVTSNYRYDLAPYTWELVQNLRSGRALFTQPPMPIKCAGAPQKAMYLSGDHWYRTGVLRNIEIEFYNAGGVLFGVKEYVPALMEYVKKYNAQLNFWHNLVKVDGPSRTAWFLHSAEGKEPVLVERRFDMMHVAPPQTAPDFVRVSPLADANGWVDVDQSTLRHKHFDNIYALGDVANAPFAKTAAAARKQVPVVAINLLNDLGLSSKRALYDGYGSCPLTVERGKIVMAEFGYGGKLMPSFPSFILDGRKPTWLAWMLKAKALPPIYWQGMLKGNEIMCKTRLVDALSQPAGGLAPAGAGGGCG